ncbi:MAG TPA: hypothetical protein VKE40_15210 [Gemmataceae bacterium]|nr:hypothetical protein [Gemmataceae bacterium]
MTQGEEEDALFQAIAGNPEDDAPKCAHADQLRERGAEAAAFALEWAIEWSQMPRRTDDATHPWEWIEEATGELLITAVFARGFGSVLKSDLFDALPALGNARLIPGPPGAAAQSLHMIAK